MRRQSSEDSFLQKHAFRRSRSRDKFKQRSNSRSRKYSSSSSSSVSLQQPAHSRLSLASKAIQYVYSRSNDYSTPALVWLFVRAYSRRHFSTKVVITCDTETQYSELLRNQGLNRRKLFVSNLAKDQEAVARDFISGRAEIMVITTMMFSILLAKQRAALESTLQLIVKLDSPTPATCVDVDRECFRTYVNSLMNSSTVPTILHLGAANQTMLKDIIRDCPRLKAVQITKDQIDWLYSDQHLVRQTEDDIQYFERSNTTHSLSTRFLQQNCDKDKIIEALIQLYFQTQRNRVRSVHLGLEQHQTYQLTTPVPFTSIKYVWNYLREHLPQHIVRCVKGLSKLKNQMGAVFDLPIFYRPQIDLLIQEKCSNKSRVSSHNGSNHTVYQLSQVRVLPELFDEKQQSDKKELKEFALRHKSELQIYIGGLPPYFTEELLKQWLAKFSIQSFNVRILRDTSMRCKGIGFGLCADHSHFQKAIQLSQKVTIDGRPIKINLANQKQQLPSQSAPSKGHTRNYSSHKKHYD